VGFSLAAPLTVAVTPSEEVAGLSLTVGVVSTTSGMPLPFASRQPI
jgi:hypothetical protein